MFNDKITLPIKANYGREEEFNILTAFGAPDTSRHQWEEHEQDGRLAIDVAQTSDELLITAPMAGAPPEQISLHLHNDLLTIKGWRNSPMPAQAEHFYNECYWGKFSRSLVLPVDVKYELAQAEYKNGVLLIRLPKKDITGEIPILVIDE